jgi:hypothetical protein
MQNDSITSSRLKGSRRWRQPSRPLLRERSRVWMSRIALLHCPCTWRKHYKQGALLRTELLSRCRML